MIYTHAYRISLLSAAGIARSYIMCAACLLLCLTSMQSCSAGERGKEVHYSVTKYPFIHPERNEIIHAEVMDSFFDQLMRLRSREQLKVNILQIGDSHIQADLLSDAIRTDFKNDFGNGGRGLVVPLRVGGTNESFNYKITSNVVCTSKRCVFVNDPMPIGVGGMTIRSFSENTTFRIRTFNYPNLNASFNKLTLFYQKDSSAFDFDILDTAGRIIGSIHHALEEPYNNISRADLPMNTNDVTLRAKKLSDTQNQATVFGINLENDSSGVIYHSVGINGAEAFQYVRAQYFAEQTQALSPSLIIISLGTNEAQRLPFDKNWTISKLDSLVRALRLYNPKAAILLTTPADSYFRKKYYNNSLAALHTAMVEYAAQNNVAIWDLYSIGGGFKSCYQWKRYGLMRADGIHFGKQGYEFQGNLLYESIAAAYNKYVKAHTNQTAK